MAGRDRHYEIRVGAHLDGRWRDWFEGLSLANEANGEALITIPAGDQALLHGVLDRIRDLNVKLLAVSRVDPPFEPVAQAKD